MKKFAVAVLMAVLLAAEPAFAGEYNSKNKLLWGLFLTVAGSVMAIDGFSQVKDDLSQPRVNTSNFSMTTSMTAPTLWYATCTGKVTNSGNIDLSALDVTVKYYEASGVLVAQHTYSMRDALKDTTYDWSINNAYCGTSQPVTASVSTDYTYERLYRKRNKSDTEGVAGLVCLGAGIYFIVDYIVDLNGVENFMKSHELEVKTAQKTDTMGLTISKRL